MKNPQSFYERHVKNYQKVTNLWFPKRHQKLISLIYENPKNILDVGCGTGVMLERIESKFPDAKLFGVDLSEPMISFAKDHYPDYNFEISNAESLPYSDKTFDVVTNAISFHHYHNPGKAVEETYRVLKSGGQFLLMDITPKHTLSRVVNNFGAKYIIRDGHTAFHSLYSIKVMFEKAGFQSTTQYFVGFPGVYVTVGIKPKE